MKLYEYDIWDGDKGVIFANSEEEAVEIVRKEYSDLTLDIYGYNDDDDDWDEDDDNEIMTCDIRFLLDEIPTEPSLVFVQD